MANSGYGLLIREILTPQKYVVFVLRTSVCVCVCVCEREREREREFVCGVS